MIGRALRYFAASGTTILAFALLIGIVIPPLAAYLRPILPAAVAVILTLAMLRVDWHRVLELGERPVLMTGALVWFLAVSPMLMWLLVGALDVPAGLASALVLMTAAPPITAGLAFAVLIGLDASLCLVNVTVATLIAPLTLPVLALGLLGLDLAIDIVDLMARLGVLIGGSFILGVIGRRVLGTRRLQRWPREIDGVMVIMLIIFGISIMDGVTERLLADPSAVLTMAAVAFAANVGLQVLGALAFARTGRLIAVTTGFLTGNRNMALLLAVLPATTDSDTLLYFAIGQFPMFMLPAVLAPIYRRVLKK